MEKYSRINLISPDEFDMTEIGRRTSHITAEMIEMFAAAYLKETDIKPSEAELVMEYRPTSVAWYFRKREHYTSPIVDSGNMK